jgi:putative PIN family toxin of toxin-antitoxin system
MLRVVLDSSVLISAFLTPRGTCAELLRRAASGAFVICLSPELLEDMVTPLLRAAKLQELYQYDRQQVAAFCEGLMRAAEQVTDLPELPDAVPLDPKDNPIVATAVKAHADFLVTGDRKHLLSLGSYGEVRIISPREFLALAGKPRKDSE